MILYYGMGCRSLTICLFYFIFLIFLFQLYRGQFFFFFWSKIKPYIYLYNIYIKKKRCPPWSKVSIPNLIPHLAHWKSLSLFLLKLMILKKRDERKIKFLTFYVMPDVGSMNFKIFTLIPLNIVSQTLKIAIDVFSKYSV